MKSRQTKLLVLLCKQNKIRPIRYFANELGVSNKTIRNDLDEIELFSKNLGFEIVRLQGHGIEVKETVDNSLNKFLANYEFEIPSDNSMYITSRRREILNFLLNHSNEYTSNQILSEKYFVSISSIVQDFKSIEIWLKNHDLELYRGQEGTKVIGSEDKIRRAIAQYIIDFPSTFNKNSNTYASSRIDVTTMNMLQEMFEAENISFFEHIISEMEMMLNINIPEPYYLNLITHLLISINRLEFSEDLKEDKVETRYSSPEYVDIISRITQKIEKKFNMIFSEKEKNYILQYILGSVSEGTYNHANYEVERIVDLLINNMELIMSIPFSKDLILKKGLVMHLKPMINRVKFGIKVTNPLKDVLQDEHKDIFIPVSFTMNFLMNDVFEAKLTEDEISYIVTYFVASIERDYREYKVVVVCHSGFGTSQLLTARLERAFPNLEIVDTISLSRVNKQDFSDVDFIISTVYIAEPPVPYIVVSVLLSDDEITKISTFIKDEIKYTRAANMDIDANILRVDNLLINYEDIFNRNEFCLGVSPNIKEEIIICEKKNTIILSGTKKEILENFKKINYLAQNVGWERIKYGFIKDLK